MKAAAAWQVKAASTQARSAKCKVRSGQIPSTSRRKTNSFHAAMIARQSHWPLQSSSPNSAVRHWELISKAVKYRTSRHRNCI